MMIIFLLMLFALKPFICIHASLIVGVMQLVATCINARCSFTFYGLVSHYKE